MENYYLKITPYVIAKKLGLNVLECQRSTGALTTRDEDDDDAFCITIVKTNEDGSLRAIVKYIYN